MDRSMLFYKLVILTYNILRHNDVEGSKDNFNGMRFRMAAETWEPFILVSEESGGISYSGIMPKILDYLQVSLNFTTSVARPPDGGWGAIDDRGNWGGMVGMVKRNEVDFALGEFTYLYGTKQFCFMICLSRSIWIDLAEISGN